jgi:hypothetical protein
MSADDLEWWRPVIDQSVEIFKAQMKVGAHG